MGQYPAHPSGMTVPAALWIFLAEISGETSCHRRKLTLEYSKSRPDEGGSFLVLMVSLFSV